MNPTTLDHITEAAKTLAGARQQLLQMTQALDASLEALKANAMPEIRQGIDQATTAWTALERLIQANPHLFVKPRTVAAHGIRFGIEKGKGVITLPPDAKAVALIRKHCPEQAELLINVVETPVKKAIAQLPIDLLRKIGGRVEDTADRVVIRPADSDVDKLVKALIKADVEETATTSD